MAADITPFIKDAQDLQKATGIPASITLGQIILESSGGYPGGLSGLAYHAKNLFGIKGTGPAGTYSAYSKEYDAGGNRVSGFRKYNSYYESMQDHARLLQTDRYSKYLSSAKTVEDFAKGIKAGGYATDPNYAQLLLGVIKSNGLAKYDDGTPYTGAGGADSKAGESKGIVGELITAVIRVVILLLCFIAAMLFLAKAFPVVEETAKKVM